MLESFHRFWHCETCLEDSTQQQMQKSVVQSFNVANSGNPVCKSMQLPKFQELSTLCYLTWEYEHKTSSISHFLLEIPFQVST